LFLEQHDDKLRMTEIKEVDDDTQKQHSISQYSDKLKKISDKRQSDSKAQGKKAINLNNIDNLYYDNLFAQSNNEAAFMSNPDSNPAEVLARRGPQTASGNYRPRKATPGNLGHDELITEINELK